MKRLVTAIALGALAGCAGMDWDANDNRVGYTEQAPAPAEETAALKDPVTGETVTIDSAWQTTHDGKTYYFASEDSLKRFQENPAPYIQAEVK